MLPGFAIISAAFTLTGLGVYGLSYIKWGWKVRRALAVTHTRTRPRRPLPLARTSGALCVPRPLRRALTSALAQPHPLGRDYFDYKMEMRDARLLKKP